MDARDYHIVTSSDIDNALNHLKKRRKAYKLGLPAGVKIGESIFPPNCKTNISLDHKAGDEANSVKVTYVKTCRGIKYIEASLHKKGSDILNALAKKQLGENFSSALSLHVQVLNAKTKGVNQDTGILTVSISGVWFYQFSSRKLDQINRIAAGQPVNEVLKDIRKIPGVMEARINFVGFGNEYFLPKNTRYIRSLIVYRLS